MSHEPHQIAQYFPLLQGRNYEELREHIRTHGLIDAIILYEGKILDGRNRYRACRDTGVEPRFEEFAADGDPWAFVWGKNVDRRHLAPGQTAAIRYKFDKDSDTWRAAREAATDAANAARSEATKAQPRSEDGTRLARSVTTLEPTWPAPAQTDAKHDDGHPFVCRTCGERFSTEVWHCPQDHHHWSIFDKNCKNCHAENRPAWATQLANRQLRDQSRPPRTESNEHVRLAQAAGCSPSTAAGVIALANNAPEAFERVVAGDISLPRAIKEARRAKEQEKIEQAAAEVKEDIAAACDLRVCSMQDLLCSFDGTLDAIITDPPYPEEFLPLYGALAAHAAKALKPDGVLAVMCGQSYLPQILADMSKHITYRWTLAYLTPGGQAVQLWDRMVNTFWKPILLFGGKTKWAGDVIGSDVNDNDKRFHHWGQSESGMARLVERLTEPGSLVCDPFLGAGTTAVVSLRLGRRFVGCDIAPDCITATRGRVALALQEEAT